MEARVKEILDSLTLEEKAGICSGEDCWSTKAFPQKGIPAIRTCDGPSGLRFQSDEDDHIGVHASIPTVSFPTGCAMASSFDRDLMQEVGVALGEESRSLGVGLVLGPAMNIKRTPLCGRNFEYLSEDPYLTGEIAAAEIVGIQSQNVGACAKHFACNNQETWRMRINSVVDERTLREIYLAGFETAVKKAKPCAIMSSYNRINGVAATEDRHLLTEILRDEWGFDGFVVSDWGAGNHRTQNITAGMDLEMPGCSGITDRQLVAAVNSGELAESVLDEAAARIIGKVLQYANEPLPGDFDREKHHKLAVTAAAQSAVLLKNDGAILPLDKKTKAAFIGGFAVSPRFQGGGSASVTPFRLTNVFDQIKDMPNVVYAPGFSADVDEENQQWACEAVDAARDAQCAVIFAGLPSSYESECYDRADMRLPNCQNKLIDAVCKVQSNVVVVLYSGAPVEMPWIDTVSSVLQMHTGGQGTGTAAFQLLFGQSNPCGKLAETYPLRLEDTPAYLNYPGDGDNLDYREGVFVGYRYYDKKQMPVLFPFGHGLSYTSFAYSKLQTETVNDDGRQCVRVSVNITNTGACSGKEAVQLYVSDITHAPQGELSVDAAAQVYVQELEGAVGRPQHELKGFEKVALAPGETTTVTFVLDERSFSWYDAVQNCWQMYDGNYRIMIGASSRDIRLCTDVKMESTIQRLRRVFSIDSLMSDISPDPVLWPIVLETLSHVSPKLDEIIHGTDDNSCYLREELKELPMYGVRGIYSVPQEALDALIETLNRVETSKTANE